MNVPIKVDPNDTTEQSKSGKATNAKGSKKLKSPCSTRTSRDSPMERMVKQL